MLVSKHEIILYFLSILLGLLGAIWRFFFYDDSNSVLFLGLTLLLLTKNFLFVFSRFINGRFRHDTEN